MKGRPQPLYETEFVLGVFNGASEQTGAFTFERGDYSVDQTLTDLSIDLTNKSSEFGLRMGFKFAPQQVCTSSGKVRNTLEYLEYTMGLLEPRGHERLLFATGTEDTAQSFHERYRIPGELALWSALGEEFIARIKT